MTKNPLNIEIGSSMINKGKPKSAATKEIRANHLPSDGTFFILNLLLTLLDETKSHPHPTGQRVRQNHLFLKTEITSTKKAITLSQTTDFKANTELSITKGLNQAYIPVRLPHVMGKANKTATKVKVPLMLLF